MLEYRTRSQKIKKNLEKYVTELGIRPG